MSEVKFETVEQKASYGIGLQMGQQLAGSGLEGLNVAAIAAGIATALVGEQPAISVDEINQALHAIHMRAEEARQEAAKVAASEGEAFLKDNALRPEVTVLESGQHPISQFAYTTTANWLMALCLIAQYHAANLLNSR